MGSDTEKPKTFKSKEAAMLDLKLKMVKRPLLFPAERANRPRAECITQIKTKSSLEKVNLGQLLQVKVQ